MLIRPATPDDIPALLEIERAAVTAAHWDRAAYDRIFSHDPPPRAALVAENPRLAGFIVARMLGDEWEIENVVVAESSRRQGIGAALLRAILGLAQNAAAAQVLLEVRESNLAARRLYEEAGFQVSGTRKNYYVNPKEDASVYYFCFRQ